MRSYKKLDEFLKGGRDSMWARKIRGKKATVVIRNALAETISVRYHNTEVITFHQSRRVVLRSGGWHTKTTKVRMNQHLPSRWAVWQVDGAWYVYDYSESAMHPFDDNMTIWPDGKVSYVKASNNP